MRMHREDAATPAGTPQETTKSFRHRSLHRAVALFRYRHFQPDVTFVEGEVIDLLGA